ncbi:MULTISPECIES: hypothetical protein [Chroococcidiopsis]|uniref:hypothetical protein n=1 Tax=Chroococcidiopsis TaxID=54298 RepID=UPI0002E6FD8C|nr:MULTISPECIES: hypothetical protein [Chroococcidiopsis]URD49015.1 hypothetical protein M5J74_22130 [Chroococcidiopsis sp. CCNUC1]
MNREQGAGSREQGAEGAERVTSEERVWEVLEVWEMREDTQRIFESALPCPPCLPCPPYPLILSTPDFQKYAS